MMEILPRQLGSTSSLAHVANVFMLAESTKPNGNDLVSMFGRICRLPSLCRGVPFPYILRVLL